MKNCLNHAFTNAFATSTVNVGNLLNGEITMMITEVELDEAAKGKGDNPIN